MNVNRSDLIEQLVRKYRYTKKAATDLVDDFTEIIIDNLGNGNTVSLYGFGCFDILYRKARMNANPITHEIEEIPACGVPRFYPGARMKVAVKKWESSQSKERTNGQDGTEA